MVQSCPDGTTCQSGYHCVQLVNSFRCDKDASAPKSKPATTTPVTRAPKPASPPRATSSPSSSPSKPATPSTPKLLDPNAPATMTFDQLEQATTGGPPPSSSSNSGPANLFTKKVNIMGHDIPIVAIAGIGIGLFFVMFMVIR